MQMPIRRWEILVLIGLAGMAMAREAGWVYFRLPELTRQTKRIWAMRLPSIVAAVLWGLDLGLTFSTRLTFSGVWVLALAAIFAGDPAFGALLLALYWLGRTLSVWSAPLILPDANATAQLLLAIAEQWNFFRRIHAWAIIGMAVVLFMLFIGD